MTTSIGSGAYTLMDIQKGLNPNFTVADPIPLLTQVNDFVANILWTPTNKTDSHITTLQTSLPEAVFVAHGEGAPASKDTTAQIEFPTAKFESRSEILKSLVEQNGNSASWLVKKKVPFMEAMTQKLAETWLYGSALDPKGFVGLSNIYSDLNAGNGDNIIDGSGTGSDNLSIWLVGMSENTIHGIYPTGTKAGLEHLPIKDGSSDGCIDIPDRNGNPVRAYRDNYDWRCGLSVEDWRFAVRIANIDVSALVANSSPANLPILMLKALEAIEHRSDVKYMWLMNRTASAAMPVAGVNFASAAGGVVIEEAMNQFGKPMKQRVFQGIPIHRVDKLRITEDRVVGS